MFGCINSVVLSKIQVCGHDMSSTYPDEDREGGDKRDAFGHKSSVIMDSAGVEIAAHIFVFMSGDASTSR